MVATQIRAAHLRLPAPGGPVTVRQAANRRSSCNIGGGALNEACALTLSARGQDSTLDSGSA